ncbi:MAG: MBOAT family O-acyltransferase, partial [Candidatus Omnitrophota bacterium]
MLLRLGLFFSVVYVPYLFSSHKWQNRLLLAASCLFYAAWDWRFVFLLFVSITTDYLCGLKIDETDSEKIKKRFLLISLITNLSILGFFKYFDFFVSSFVRLTNGLGLSFHPQLLHIVLPLGISYYTFKTMSYAIDVYAEKIKPTRSYLDYALFVSFFPLILAGPIMRAGDLLCQIAAPRKLRLEGFYEGCYLMFWGIFQKFFIADNLAVIADKVFNAAPPYNGMEVLLAVYAFAFQVYCDFDGYSNIARGLGKCMGFDIMINFNLPYFSTNPQVFWNRWHISLSTWLRDYLYTPIVFSGRRWGAKGAAFALMVTFMLCGLWHGAALTFIVW